MKLNEAIKKGKQSWGHYTAWQVVIKNLRRVLRQNKDLRRELETWKRHSASLVSHHKPMEGK